MADISSAEDFIAHMRRLPIRDAVDGFLDIVPSPKYTVIGPYHSLAGKRAVLTYDSRTGDLTIRDSSSIQESAPYKNPNPCQMFG